MNRFYPLLFVIAIFLLTPLYAQVPDGTTGLSGIEKKVEVRRDPRGIPYIEAMSEADLYFVQGYVTASDRLWQMDLLRRVARGETAEIFGNAALEEDKRWRRFGFSRIADRSFEQLSPDLRAGLENYAKGVNAYIAALDARSLPVEFQILQYKPREWKPSDSIVIGKILTDALSTSWRNDLLRASIRDLPEEKIADLTDQVTPYDVVLFGKDTVRRAAAGIPRSPISPVIMRLADIEAQVRADSLARIGLYAEELAASNNWVISGKRTGDGKPILANDPHLAPTAPGIWYLSHLSAPDLRVSGATLPGVPGIILGHNEFIAWGATNAGPDVQDLYIETFNEQGEYKTPEGWQKPSTRTEVIKVRTNPTKPDTSAIEFTVTQTRNGVIILEESAKKYALKWTALDPGNGEFEAFHLVNRARNWDDFKSALSTYGGATQNFVYADIKGNIGWYAAGRIPLRKKGSGELPYEGSTTDGEWVGFIPFSELPHLYDPPAGFIVTANQRIVGTGYKYAGLFRDAAPPWRARRLYDLISRNKKVTVEDTNKAQNDIYNIPLADLAKEIVKLGTASPETTAALKVWDGRMTRDSQAAVLANEIRNCIAVRMAEGATPAPAPLIRERVTDRAIRERSAIWLPSGFANYGALIKACDTVSRKSLSDPKRLGPDPDGWVWGKIWQARFPHPLASVPFIGAQFAVNPVPIVGSSQSPNVGSGVSMRHIAVPGDWDVTRHVVPLGQSGDPRSKHFRDQFDLWSTGATEIFPFSKTAVAKAAQNVLIFTPR